VKQVA